MRREGFKTGKWNWELDKQNTYELRKIIKRYGWPGKKLVGKKGAQSVWLLAQHTPNLSFQKRCLLLYEQAVQKNDAEIKYLAYLKDRVLVRKGKKQIYGTQFKINLKTRKKKLFPLKYPRKVNLLRAEVRLDPM